VYRAVIFPGAAGAQPPGLSAHERALRAQGLAERQAQKSPHKAGALIWGRVDSLVDYYLNFSVLI